MLQILYQDADLVAVNKPAGLMVHRSEMERDAKSFALQMVRDQIERRVYPVHRLDRPASGILVFALNPAAARQLAMSFDKGAVHKTYAAVVRGFTEASGIIDKPLPRNTKKAGGSDIARRALTRYRRLASVELPFPVGRYASCRYSLLSVSPLTGRMHQIRRHLKHLSHPIIGDRVYGDNRHNRFFMEKLGCSRLLLQAVELRFPHPVRGDAITIVAGLDGSFGAVLHDFGWQPSVPAGWLPEAEVKRENEIDAEPRLTVFRGAEGPFEEVQ